MNGHRVIPIPLLAGRARRLPIGLCSMVGVIAITWYRTLIDLWYRWFPAWDQSHLSLVNRLTEGDSYYAHGPLACAASVAVAWQTYRKTGLPARRSPQANRVGVVLLTGSILLHLASVWSQITFTSGCALIGFIAGLLLIAGGWPLGRAYWIPTALLGFMVPLPMVWIAQLNFDLKMMMAQWAAWVVDFMASVATSVHGSTIVIHRTGVPNETLWIEDSCSGMRSLIALTWFTALFGAVCQLRCGWRWLICALAIPVALIANVVRIAIVILLAHQLGVEAVADDTVLHQWVAIGVFVAAVASFILFEKGVLVLELRNCAAEPSAPSIRGLKDGYALEKLRLTKWVKVTLLGTALLVAIIDYNPSGTNEVHWRPSQMDKTIRLNDEWFQGQTLTISDRFKLLLGTDHVLHRRYINQPGTAVGDLFVIHDPAGRRAVHPPLVCLQGIGSQIVSEGPVSVGLADGRSIQMREVIAKQGSLLVCHLYVYRCGRDYSDSFLGQQLSTTWRRIFKSNSGNGLVRVSVPQIRGDLMEARAMVVQLAQCLLPQVEQIVQKRTEENGLLQPLARAAATNVLRISLAE